MDESDFTDNSTVYFCSYNSDRDGIFDSPQPLSPHIASSAVRRNRNLSLDSVSTLSIVRDLVVLQFRLRHPPTTRRIYISPERTCDTHPVVLVAFGGAAVLIATKIFSLVKICKVFGFHFMICKILVLLSSSSSSSNYAQEYCLTKL